MGSQKKLQNAKSRRNEALVLGVLEKVATILLRLGFDAPKTEHMLRTAFVLAARKLAESKGVRSTQSQIALVAGVNRLDVRRIIASSLDPRFAREVDQHTRIERILAGWRQDPLFADTRGRPKPLTIVGPKSEFSKLTRKYGRDVTARTLRDTMVQNNLAKLSDGKIILREHGSPDIATVTAGASDLGFLSSQLDSFDLQTGRRTSTSRQLSFPAKDAKSLKLLQRKAVGKIETAFGSLESVVLRTDRRPKRKGARGYRLVITTTLTSEASASDPE